MSSLHSLQEYIAFHLAIAQASSNTELAEV